MTAPQHPTIIGVRPAAALITYQRLFQALERAFSVRFAAHVAGAPGVGGVVAIGQDAVSDTEGMPAIAFPATADRRPDTREVHIAVHAGVDRRLNGVVLRGQVTGRGLRPEGRHQVLASSSEGPVWARREGRELDLVSVPLPDLRDGATLFEALHGPHSLALAALVQFLRSSVTDGWTVPPVRCAFVFDDPNLRRSRYGYIDYRQLIRHADAHGYHAAMAMVPLDASLWRRDTVAMFSARPDRLSLVMHGNNHSARELMNTPDLASALALGAQALRRIASFEANTELRVDRVMMPPHSVWSRIGARALGALPYDALCSTHSHPTTESRPGSAVLAGWERAEFVDGCAVLPRVSLSLDRTGIALRAFLDQPLVLYGHHGDLACGLDPLAEAAARVNGLGEVRWCSVGEIAQGNSAIRIRDRVAHVRPAAQRPRLTIPDGVHAVSVHAPAFGIGGIYGWSQAGVGGPPRALGEPAAVGAGEAFLRLHTPWTSDPEQIASPPRSMSAVLRRRMSEARDRLAPVRGRLIGKTT